MRGWTIQAAASYARPLTQKGQEKMLENDKLLLRIAEALERLAPSAPTIQALSRENAWIWEGERSLLQPVDSVDHQPLANLLGIDAQKRMVLANTTQFAHRLSANNILLWGARGMGKSSLVKAVHAHLCAQGLPLSLVEIHREEIETLPILLKILRYQRDLFILLCDDLSFEATDTRYKALKSVLEGGLEGRPANVLFYATSNQRHLMPRFLSENDAQNTLNQRDQIDDKLALSDRFGLWIGFHACDQETYLAMVHTYMRGADIKIPAETLEKQALEWAITRGARSGRVAFQFSQHLLGQIRLESAP
jgi:uncharacterized protein